MARTAPKVKASARAQALMNVSPVQRAFDAAVTGYENMTGLNVGGAESGRQAKAKALARYKSSMLGRANMSGNYQVPKGINPGDVPGQKELEDLISGKTRPQ